MPPSTWVNFADIKKRVSIADVLLKFYRIDNLKHDGDKLIGPCPVHQGDSPRAFHADTTKNLWHCFSHCQSGGNQLDLVAKKEDISIRDAALKLQAFFLAGESSASHAPTPASKVAPEKPAKPLATAASSTESTDESAKEENPPLDLKLDLKPDHPHLLHDRGLKLETVKHFGIGYCSRGMLRGMIAIPIHDDEGVLVAYAGRRLKPVDIREHGKYRLPKGFKKELVLYNLHRAKEYQKEHGLILVEGFFSVVKLYEAGLKNVVAPMGCELSEEQARLCSEAKEVIILFDGNDAGYHGAATAKAKLTPYVPVRVVKLPLDTEPESFPGKTLRWVVNGITALDLAEVNFVARPTGPASDDARADHPGRPSPTET